MSCFENFDYIVKVGKEADYRLKLLNNIFRKNTISFYKNLGLRPGVLVLEAGCGTGYLTIDIAREIAPNGRVVAIDISEEQIAIASANAKAANVSNIEFLVHKIEDSDKLPFKFDMVLSRFVLMHIKDPMSALTSMLNSLTSQGVLACEEPSMSDCFSSIASDSFDIAMYWHMKYAELVGINFNIGKELYSMIVNHSVTSPNIQIVQPVVKNQEIEKYIFALLTKESKDKYLEKLIATEYEIDKVIYDLEILAKNPNVYFGCAKMFQIGCINNK